MGKRSISRTLYLALLVAGCGRPATDSAPRPADASANVAHDLAMVAPRSPGQPFFVDGGGQAIECEPGSPPVAIIRGYSRSMCWYAGATCAGRGTQIRDPFTLKGTVVSGMRTHSGCDLGTYALVYKPGTSPLELRVCETRPPPIDCPAMVNDGAEWNIAPLLDANHVTKARLLAH